MQCNYAGMANFLCWRVATVLTVPMMASGPTQLSNALVYICVDDVKWT